MKTRQLTFAALCLALALLLPQIFHMMGMQQAGQIFLPMHIPIFMAGMVLGWQYGALLGLLAPLASFLLSGMPDAARVLFMMLELMSYGAISGFLYRSLRLHDQLVGGYIALLGAMLGGRLMYGFLLTLCAFAFQLHLGGFAAVWAALVTGIPGIIIQLLFLPALVHVVEKGGYFHETILSKANTE